MGVAATLPELSEWTLQIFYLENLTKPLYFRLKQNHWKVFKYSSLDIQLKQ